MKDIEYILGVDGGSTKTTAIIADIEGNPLSVYTGGPTNYKSVGLIESEKNIRSTVFNALKKLCTTDKLKNAGSCFGFSGCDLDRDIKTYNSIIFKSLGKLINQNNLIICNDSKLGLVAGSDNKNKVICICGTGSNCFGVNEYGDEAHSNGWDYILGDEGSGYSISIKVLRAIMKAYDGRGKKTALSKMVLNHLNMDTELDLVNWIYDREVTKEDIASIAKITCQAANSGDKIAQDILEQEINEAILSISTVINKLGVGNKSFDLVLVGGVFKCKRYFKDILFEILKNRYKEINIKDPVKKPVVGAVKLALKSFINKY